MVLSKDLSSDSLPQSPLIGWNLDNARISASHSHFEHLSLRLERNPQIQRSTVVHQYTTYPYRVSSPLTLDSTDQKRTYLYLMNTSPGILAGDNLRLNIELGSGSHLHLTDQAATKVHTMADEQRAMLSTQIQVGSQASLEYVPEPIILYSNSYFAQNTQLTIDPTATVFLSEMILPGRLARDEWYAFRQYDSRLKIFGLDGDLLVADSMRLQGHGNLLTNSSILTQLPAIATIILILPDSNIESLISKIQDIPDEFSENFRSGVSKLPNVNGLFIRSIADRTSRLKHYIHFCLNCVRQVTHSPQLPEIPK